MQIKKLVLYGVNGETREVDFDLGKLNVIVGESKTGKSAIGDIIEYCLCSSECRIPVGVIRDTVAWFALILDFGQEQMLVARKSPGSTSQSSEVCYYEIGRRINVPVSSSNLASNINRENLRDVISEKMGIGDTRGASAVFERAPSFPISVRHAMFYCVQSQGEIASRDVLFHNQARDFALRDVRESLPYFLDAIPDDVALLMTEKKRIDRDIKELMAKIDAANVHNASFEAGSGSILQEAILEGIVEDDCANMGNDASAIRECLRRVSSWDAGEPASFSDASLRQLQEELHAAETQLFGLQDARETLRSFVGIAGKYGDMTQQKQARLRSIGLFKGLCFDPDRCPFCGVEINSERPSIAQMKNAILDLSAELETVTKDRTKIAREIEELDSRISATRKEIVMLQERVEGAYSAAEQLNQGRSKEFRRAMLAGRATAWLETHPPTDELISMEGRLGELQKRLQEIDQKVDGPAIQIRIDDALAHINRWLSKWVNDLGVEHGGHPFRFDIRRCTVVIDFPDRTVEFKSIGSGENWVEIHLAALLSLHQWFRERGAPTPRFLFLDQPSQISSVSDGLVTSADALSLARLFQFLYERTKDGEFQIIVVDHVELDTSEFKDSVIAKWEKDGEKLIPSHWYR